MVITKISPIDKKRSRIWLDEEFAFVLYKGELRRFNIVEGEELKENDYFEITKQLLPRRAKLRAMNLLQKHTYSVRQLYDKLMDGDYPESIVYEALDYVASYGYTDDSRLCEEYIRIHLDSKSRQRIVMDLLRKGIDKDTINSAFDKCNDEGFSQNEALQIKKLLDKRGFDVTKGPDQYSSYDEYRKEYAKQYAFLLRKGFSSENISRVIGGEDDLR